MIPPAILTIPPATRRTTSGSAAKRRSRDCRTGPRSFVGRHRSVWVFLGPPHFGAKTPVYKGWEFLGFPWILSSESRLINGLRGIYRGSFFLSPVLAKEAGTGSCGRGHSEGRDCSWGELTSISDCQQLIVARPRAPGRRRQPAYPSPAKPASIRAHAPSAHEFSGAKRVRVAHAIRICGSCAAGKQRETSQSRTAALRPRAGLQIGAVLSGHARRFPSA
jgi:hypothetical protein